MTEAPEKNSLSTLTRFLASWNVERIERMTIAEYADLSDHDSLCYWLEYGTKDLGAIGGIHLQKFELWKSGPGKEFKDNRFKLENGYAWNANKGGNLTDAFTKIRQLIIDIVRCSLRADWEAIDGIPFHAIGKWKIAFLFSGNQLLPIYSRRALLAVAYGMGLTVDATAKISVLQRAILSLKDPQEDILAYAGRLYSTYAEKTTPKRYFIVGSMYSDGSVMKTFLSRSCVAIGWIDWADFSGYMGAERQEIDKYVNQNYGGTKPKPGILKGYFRTFSEISEGDIIAVKSKGSFNDLTIIAYAQVVKRNGSVYYHDNGNLGHCIHVEFLDANFSKYIGANYAQTIHRLSPAKDGGTFYDVFGWYTALPHPAKSATTDSSPSDEPPAAPIDDSEDDIPPDEGYNEKSETPFERTADAKVFVKLIHNEMQNRFIKYLKKTYPGDHCAGEKNYVDAKRVSGDDLYLYEIKPDASVYACIRQGIGQLLDYRFQDKSRKNKIIVIVGQTQPTPEDQQFIDNIKATLTVSFHYLAFNQTTMSASLF